MKRFLAFILVLATSVSLLTFTSTESARSAEGFALFADGTAAPIFVSSGDYKQILRAVNDLSNDVKMVSGITPVVSNAAPSGGLAVIIGSVEKSPLIQQIISAGKLPEAAAISGKWESYVAKVVDDPLPGVAKALVIAGSDKRGTIYGVYKISEIIGVSPYYYFADVTPKTKTGMILADGIVAEAGEPSVKYRGIFINDERNLRIWSEKFVGQKDILGNTAIGTPSSAAYEKIFELMLRLGANTLWPAMHGYSSAFNYYKDANGVSLNAQVADAFGIVMGSSHCEPMLRNSNGDGNRNEWDEWITAYNAANGRANSGNNRAYDFSVNAVAITQYWRDSVREKKDFEAVWTIGMRGRHDGEMGYSGTNGTLAARIGVLQNVINTQRQILSEELGKPAAEIPQVFIPYKEAADYYNGNATTPGVIVPDDVIIMWAEDNHGNLRQTPTAAERARSGGGGVYTHISYWGSPSSYLWLETTPLAHIYEELRKAYDTGAGTYWIVNVGSIKPRELALEFAMSIARDIDAYDYSTIKDYLSEKAKRDFLVDDTTAEEIANIMDEYYHYAISKRPEFMGMSAETSYSAPYSITTNGDEAQIMVDRFVDLFNRTQAIYDVLDPVRKDAFYEMVFYQIRAARYMIEKNVYWQKNQTYSSQGRFGSVNAYAELSRRAYNNISSDLEYYNNTMAGGKWKDIIYPYAIYAPSYDIPAIRGALNYVEKSMFEGIAALGAVCEGQTLGTETVTLRFSNLTNDKRFIDVFNKGAEALDYTIETSGAFIVVDEPSGTIPVEKRVWASIDWDKAAAGTNTGTITVKEANGDVVKTFSVSASKTTPDTSRIGYYEANGLVAIEAENYSSKTDVNGASWKLAEGWGRSGSSMRVYPDVSPRIEPGNYNAQSAYVDYDVFFTTTGTFTATVFRNPTLNEGSENGVSRTCRIALGVDDQAAVHVGGVNNASGNAWSKNVMEYIEKINFSITIPTPGWHTIKVYKVDAGIGFDRLIINTGGMPTTYLGPWESYNTISFEEAPISNPPEIAAVDYGDFDNFWFSFGRTGQAAVEGYTSVPTTRVYNGSNGYGWAAGASLTEAYRSSATANTCERERSLVYGSSAATFIIKMPDPGKYTVAIAIGDRASSSPRATSNMTVMANGVTVLSGINLTGGRSMEYGVAAETNAYGELALTFGGAWSVSSIEIMPWAEPQKDGNSGVFVMEGGMGYIEAESALEGTEFAYTRQPASTAWTLSAGISGMAMYHGPNTNSNYNTASTAGMANSPSMNFRVRFDRSGSHRIWALIKPVSADDDSLHIGINNAYSATFNPSSPIPNDYQWVNVGAINVPSAGVHTVHIWGREDGVKLDKFFITAITTVTPSGVGGTVKREATVADPPDPPDPPGPVPLYENFEAMPLGAFTGNSFWTQYSTGTGNICQIVADPLDPSNKLLRLNRSGGALGIYATGLNMKGIFTIEMRISRATTAGNQYGLYTYDRQYLNTSNPSGMGNPTGTVALSSGEIRTHNVRGASTTVTAGRYAANEWYTIQNVVNMDTGLYDFYIDGVRALSNQTLRTWTAALAVDVIQLYGADGTGDLFCDYIYVYPGAPDRKINKFNIYVAPGLTYDLQGEPGNAEWSAGNTSVASVSAGAVTGVANGKTLVSLKSGEKYLKSITTVGPLLITPSGLTASVSGGRANVSVNISNGMSPSYTPLIIIASYDNAGRLVDIKQAQQPIAGGATLQVSENLAVAASGYIKLFLWNTNFVPIHSPVKISY